MKKIDRDALTRAMEMARRDPGRAWQLDSMLEDRSWEEVARFASYVVQGDLLRLYPWETPPESIDENGDDPRDAAGRKLLRRMLKAGLSRYEPDPLGALAAVKQKAAS